MRNLVVFAVSVIFASVVASGTTGHTSESESLPSFRVWKAKYGHSAYGTNGLTDGQMEQKYEQAMKAVKELNQKQKKGEVSPTIGVSSSSSSSCTPSATQSCVSSSSRSGAAKFAPNHFAMLSESEFKNSWLNKWIDPSARHHSKKKENHHDDIVNTYCTTTPPGLLGYSVNTTYYTQQFTKHPSWDWQEKGAVTRIRNQGACGSCYIFSIVAMIEGLYQIKYGTLLAFSEQYVLDCGPQNYECLAGCQGGNTGSLASVLVNGDKISKFPLAKNYEYESYNNQTGYTCNAAAPLQPNTQLKRAFKVITQKDSASVENAMLTYVQTRGPLAIAVDASSAAWQHYASGILDPCGVLPNDGNIAGLNHGVTIVGYGTSSEGVDYWKIKNSWTPMWGEEGYIRIRRGCSAYGLASLAIGGSFDEN